MPVIVSHLEPILTISSTTIPVCPNPVVVAQPKPQFLQLGLGLRLLQDGVQLGRLHDVALDLELPGHEQPLCIALARDQVTKVGVGERKRYCDFRVLSALHLPLRTNIPWLRHTIGLLADALGDLALALQVDVPALSLAGCVLKGEGVDAVPLLDGIFLIGLAGVEGLVDRLEGSRGGELVCFGSEC